jgi:hypothetical protein
MESRQVIRCSAGHLYTATWIPHVSLRDIRMDRCPIDGRWQLARVVDPAELTDAELAEAQEHYSGVRH